MIKDKKEFMKVNCRRQELQFIGKDMYVGKTIIIYLDPGRCLFYAHLDIKL